MVLFILFGISHRESCSFFTLGFQVKSQALKHNFKYNKAQLSNSCSGLLFNLFEKGKKTSKEKKFCFLLLWPSHSVGEMSKWWKHFVRHNTVFHRNQHLLLCPSAVLWLCRPSTTTQVNLWTSPTCVLLLPLSRASLPSLPPGSPASPASALSASTVGPPLGPHATCYGTTLPRTCLHSWLRTLQTFFFSHSFQTFLLRGWGQEEGTACIGETTSF